MKKNILSLSALVLVAATLITSCGKDDTTAPVISLTGDASITISLQDTYTELGATATDDEDGAITPSVSGTVNEDLTGTYTITYTATDAAGNTNTATRTVVVANDAAALAGTYTASETDVNGPYTYTAPFPVITPSTTVNNRVELTLLGDFNNNTVYMNITGTTITIPSQTVSSVGAVQTPPDACDVHSRQTDGTGTITTNGFTLTYNDAKVAPCSGTRTAVAATFVKQ